MAGLEDYLESAYLTYRQHIEGLEAALSDAVKALALTNTARGWYYQYCSGGAVVEPGTVSHGTMSMVLTAVGRASGLCSTSSGAIASCVQEFGTSALFIRNLAVLANDMTRISRTEGEKKPQLPSSESFGDGNPLTLSHVVDLLSSLDTERVAADLTEVQRRSLDESKSAISAAITAAEPHLQRWLSEDFDEITPLRPRDKKVTYHRNAFIPLRTIRSAIDFAKLGLLGDLSEILLSHRPFFEMTLHEQLSFSAIPDSRFDAAELVFSLEGLVLCSKDAVDSTLFCRVLEVLEEKQNTSAHWRPSRPFLAAATGAIFLPLSVEVANSLMRSIEIMDEGLFHDTYTSMSIPLLRRFWSWLQARAVRLSVKGEHCLGWHSEHINAADLVHPWDTSLVVDFMISYRELLEREIQTTTLRRSGLQWARPKGPPRENAYDAWKDVVKKMEPSLGSPKRDQVYDRIGEDFVAGWAKGKPANYSMLLYGPPGTGKTSVAENLSQTLNMPLVTVTVSDFLGSGGANVESRAKAIFQTLEHQRNVVILFDEIDSFLLDRDSALYRNQDSLFQFLTPGMLTKINNLRKAKRCIFIIATNYENRIDPAIKRTGRIDQSYLLPLPDAKRRQKILQSAGLPSEGFSEALQKESLFFGYGDLDKAAKAAGGDSNVLLEELRSRSPATTLASYVRRFEAEDFPVAEFKDLLRLADDAGGSQELEKLKQSPTWKKLEMRLEQ
ncbi:AAA family ATPase [Sinorhizobium medicae]|nr:AAA family ATPase [Sinorhizobium medicae]